MQVAAAGVDRGVWHVMTGLPYPIRIAGYGLRAPKTPVPGVDVAGVVDAVGEGVTRFRVGDEVFGFAKGAFAEYARAPESKLAHNPVNVTAQQSAVLAVSGLAALQALRDHAKVQEGQSVLVIGASGGVGTYAVQLARRFGAEVTAVCSTSKVEMVRSLGARRVIDYTERDFAEGGERYDATLDIGGTDRQVRALVLSRFVGQTLTTFIARENADDLIALAALVESGSIAPVIDRMYPLAEAPDAIRYVEEGRARGKVVVAI